MPVIEGAKQTLTFDSILLAMAVIVALIGILVTFVKGWEAIKKISVRDRVKDLEDRMKKVEERLETGNRRFQHQSEDMGQILQTLNALQLHFKGPQDPFILPPQQFPDLRQHLLPQELLLRRVPIHRDFQFGLQ